MIQRSNNIRLNKEEWIITIDNRYGCLDQSLIDKNSTVEYYTC